MATTTSRSSLTGSTPSTCRTRRRRLAVAAASLSVMAAAGGMAAANMTSPDEPADQGALSAIFPPCDGFSDCIHTAYWWAFQR